MKSDLKILLLLTASFLAAAPAVRAQFGPKTPSFDNSYLKLFRDAKAFSAQSEVRVQDSTDKETMTMPMSFALLDGKTRSELQLTDMKSANMPPGSANQMKQFGMDRMVNVARPDKQVSYIIYPSLKAYAEMPISKDAAAKPAAEPKIEKTELGKETVDGHPCVKSKVIITDEDGTVHEAEIWAASDLKDFPIQMKMKDKGSTITMHYRNVQFTKPDAKLFEPPAGFTKYNSVQELMQSAIGGLRPPPAR